MSNTVIDIINRFKITSDMSMDVLKPKNSATCFSKDFNVQDYERVVNVAEFAALSAPYYVVRYATKKQEPQFCASNHSKHIARLAFYAQWIRHAITMKKPVYILK